MCLRLSHVSKAMPGPFSASFFFLPSECVTPFLYDLLEFRRAELVPWFADLLAFFLIAFIVHSELQESESKALLLSKSHSEASHTISKKTARSCHTKQVRTIMVHRYIYKTTFSHIWEGARRRVLVGAASCTHNIAHERTTRAGMFHCSAIVSNCAGWRHGTKITTRINRHVTSDIN